MRYGAQQGAEITGYPASVCGKLRLSQGPGNGARGPYPFDPTGRMRMADATARSRAAVGGELTEAQKQAYWSYNVKLTTVLLVIWFVVTYIISGLMAGWLNNYTILGFPLGYYMAAQGSLAIFVIEIAVYAKLMNAKDEEYGIREEG